MRNRSYDFFYVAAVATFIWQNSDSYLQLRHNITCTVLLSHKRICGIANILMKTLLQFNGTMLYHLSSSLKV